MEFSERHTGKQNEITELFRATFTASEGKHEGTAIAHLTKDLLVTTRNEDLFVFSAVLDNIIVGCIVFSRLKYEQDDRTVFLLSPVAVTTEYQGRGIGQKLLKFGLGKIREQGVDIAITYGDSNYYGKVGFDQITTQQAKPPLNLGQPNGWLAQSLTGGDFIPLKGPSQCVAAFNNPDYW